MPFFVTGKRSVEVSDQDVADGTWYRAVELPLSVVLLSAAEFVRPHTNFRCRYAVLRDPGVTELHGEKNRFLSFLYCTFFV